MAANNTEPANKVNRAAAAGGAMTDDQLLQAYLGGKAGEIKSGEAFAALVERHTPMVYATCLRMVRDPHAAEDATQATFLVLMRKAADLRPSTLLAGWLYATAQSCARDLLRAQTRRNKYERQATDMNNTLSTDDPAQAALWSDLKNSVDQELGTLPSEQRDAILLRYLYGYSETDAARQMGCTESNLHARVSRGMARLREKLRPRGVALSAVALAAFLSQGTAEAAPAALSTTITSVCLGKTAASATAAATANGIIKAATLLKLKAAALVIAALLVVATPVVVLKTLNNAQPAAPTPPTSSSSTPAAVEAVKPPPVPASALPALPQGSKVLFEEKFSADTAGWYGTVVPAPSSQAGDFALQAVKGLEDLTVNFFAEVRSTRSETGFAVGKHTYLRLRYFAQGFGVDEFIKIMVKEKDQLNYGGFVHHTLRDKWTTLTVRLDDSVPFINNPLLRLKEGETLYQLVVIAYTNANRAPAAKLFIDDVTVFEAPEAITAKTLDQDP